MSIKETLFGEHRKYGLVALVVIGALLLSMGTYSFWSDDETVSGNNIEAGTLDLTVDNGANDTISLTNAQPGDADSHTFSLRNVGSTEADHVAMDLSFAEQTDEPAEPADSDLNVEQSAAQTAAMVEVTTFSYDGTDLLGDVTDANGNGITDLADVQSQAGSLDDLAAPAAGGTDTADLTLGVQIANDDDGSFTGTDEDVMADGVDITLEFTLNQDASQ